MECKLGDIQLAWRAVFKCHITGTCDLPLCKLYCEMPCSCEFMSKQAFGVPLQLQPDVQWDLWSPVEGANVE